jgi:hypothetical protein
MICPACSRGNAAGRRYCGGCGCNFAPGCAQCGFANTQDDRFCGGCGVAMHASALATANLAHQIARAATAVAAAPAPRAATPISPTSPWAADELAVLFQPSAVAPELPELPETGISQDDINRAFGVEL